MNLPDLIKTGESENIEFKEKFDERTIESAVVFANTKGGIIFVGVSDKNIIKGTAYILKRNKDAKINNLIIQP